MNYKEYIDTLKDVCSKHPKIKNVLVGDVYDLIKKETIYPTLIISEKSVMVMNNYYDYQMSFIYVDRLTPDKSNLEFIKSDALRILNDLVNMIRVTDDIDCLDDGNIMVNFFTERFEDECAGAFIELNVQCTNPKNYQDLLIK